MRATVHNPNMPSYSSYLKTKRQDFVELKNVVDTIPNNLDWRGIANYLFENSGKSRLLAIYCNTPKDSRRNYKYMLAKASAKYYAVISYYIDPETGKKIASVDNYDHIGGDLHCSFPMFKRKYLTLNGIVEKKLPYLEF